MATLQQIRDKADAKLADFWDALILKQEQYFLKHNKFFQLLVTVPVVDGADTTFVVTKPNDEPHPVDVDFTFNSPIPFQIAVHEFVGDQAGFTVVVVVELLDGRKFTRQRTAIPTVQEATYAAQDDFDLPKIELTSKTITAWDIQTTPWSEIIEEQI